MYYLFISGTSSGIGNAITNAALNKGFRVTGFGRTCNIEHQNYQHLVTDLSDPDQAGGLKFDQYKPGEGDTVCLINNAAMLKPTGYLGNLDNDGIIQATKLNFLAPILLTNNFIRAFRHNSCQKMVINISSGAATSAIDGWTLYCATKAGLEMAANVAIQEESIRKNGFLIYSVAPGIIDTPMQDQIRAEGPQEFSRYDYFVSLKQENQLISPEQVASQFIDLILQPEKSDEQIFRLNF